MVVPSAHRASFEAQLFEVFRAAPLRMQRRKTAVVIRSSPQSGDQPRRKEAYTCLSKEGAHVLAGLCKARGSGYCRLVQIEIGRT